MKVFAPGKLILSGEHAVVYGQPALAMAVDRYVTATVTQEISPQVLFDLTDLAHRSHLSFPALQDLKARIKRKYHRFLRGEYTIRQVLQKPFELAQFALSQFAESFHVSQSSGVKIHVESNIPIGCGMGSSAATILSVIQAISHYLEIPLTPEQLFELALEAESMQHGRSSGLDLRVALQGGCLYMQGEVLSERPVPSFPMYLVNTGTPETSTGQCVEKVAPHFASTALLNDFALVTNSMDLALRENAADKWQDAIRENHRLLTQIGVVPERVQQFIASVEASHGAAKICGAGAIAGDHAGAVLVSAEDKNNIITLCTRYGYEMLPIKGDARGVRAA